MDAFEINKILQAQIKTEHEFKAPVLQKIKPINIYSDLIPDILTTKVNQSQSSFPWAEMVLLVGFAVLIIMVIIEIPKSQNYHNFIKRKDQHSIYR